MTFKPLYIVLICFLAFSSCAKNNKKNNDSEPNLQSKVDSLISNFYDNGQFHGSILIAIGDSIMYTNGFGMANDQTKNNPNTVYKIASLTKPITAALILKLHEFGKLNINDPISEYIDIYDDSIGEKVTINHLLTHSSGIVNFTSLPGSTELHQKNISPVDLINFFKDEPLNFEPGTKFEYSNSGYALLGYIAESVTEKTYAQLVEEHIFVPLGMNSSSYFNSNEFSTLSYNSNGEVEQNVEIDMSVPYAAGGIQSTVPDMYKFQQSLFDNSLLKDPLQRLIFKKGVGDYGYGWFIMEAPSFNDPNKTLTVAEHGGSMPGVTTQMTKILNDDIFIISLNNMGGAQLFPLHIKIAELIYLGDSSPNKEMELIQVR